MNEAIQLIQQILSAIAQNGFTLSALTAIIVIIIVWALKRPIISAFIVKYREYIRPVVEQLLKIMNEVEKQYPLTPGLEKEQIVINKFNEAVAAPEITNITPKSTKWLKLLGGPQFVVRYILYPAIKLFVKKK